MHVVGAVDTCSGLILSRHVDVDRGFRRRAHGPTVGPQLVVVVALASAARCATFFPTSRQSSNKSTACSLVM